MNVPTQTQPFNGGGRTITWGSSVGIQAQTFTNDSGTLTMTNPQALYVQACVAGTNVTATNGPYAIYANGVSRLTGIQIDDPASTMSHYHEGTWTPTLDFHTTPGSHTYDSRSGYYIQIGSLVVASFQVVLTNLASCSGIAGIKDLPKPVKVVTNISWSGHLGYHSGITSNTNKDFIVMIAGPSDGQFRLYENGIGGTASITDADFANDSRLSGTLIYNTGS